VVVYHVGLAVTPPSTTTFVPVIQDAIGEHRKATASATSDGSPSRRNGDAESHRDTPSGHASARPGRLISPGETAFTRIPRLPYSSELARACMMSAAFDVE
jgi:hypothetical protein